MSNKTGRYTVIAADPPWSYSDKKLNRGGAERYYSCMDIEQIKAINVNALAADDAILMLWATAPLLPEALEVCQAWGFKYKTVGFVWVKRSENYWSNIAKQLRQDIRDYSLFNSDFTATGLKGWFGDRWIKNRSNNGFAIGMGAYTRANAEFVLFGVKGKAAPLIQSHGVRQIIDSPISHHSKKPDDFYHKVNLLVGDVPKIELFSRQTRAGWDCLGDELENATHSIDDNFNIVGAA